MKETQSAYSALVYRHLKFILGVSSLENTEMRSLSSTSDTD